MPSAVLVLLLALPAVAAADTFFNEAVPVRSGGTLEVDIRGGQLVIETHDRDEVHVDAIAGSGLFGRAMRFRLQADGGDAELRGEGGGFFGGGKVRVTVRVPRRFNLELETSGGSIEIWAVEGSVEARTSGGRIVLDGARGDVELETSGGTIEVVNVIGSLEAETSGGGIHVSEVTGEINLETSGGPITIRDINGPVRAQTSGGKIEVRFSGQPEGELETSGGPIVAELPEGAGVDLDARTSGGRVTIHSELTIQLQGEIDSNHVRGRINGGGPTLRLKTSGGNVKVGLR